jgi:hypothetical protein
MASEAPPEAAPSARVEAAPGIGVRLLRRKGAPDAAMPMVGLGTWQAKPGELEASVGAALRSGYRHIDAAAVYGNEKEVRRSRGRCGARAVRGCCAAVSSLPPSLPPTLPSHPTDPPALVFSDNSLLLLLSFAFAFAFALLLLLL